MSLLLAEEPGVARRALEHQRRHADGVAGQRLHQHLDLRAGHGRDVVVVRQRRAGQGGAQAAGAGDAVAQLRDARQVSRQRPAVLGGQRPARQLQVLLGGRQRRRRGAIARASEPLGHQQPLLGPVGAVFGRQRLPRIEVSDRHLAGRSPLGLHPQLQRRPRPHGRQLRHRLIQRRTDGAGHQAFASGQQRGQPALDRRPAAALRRLVVQAVDDGQLVAERFQRGHRGPQLEVALLACGQPALAQEAVGHEHHHQALGIAGGGARASAPERAGQRPGAGGVQEVAAGRHHG